MGAEVASLMLAKYISLAFGALVVASFAWAGCSSDDVTVGPAADAGGDRGTQGDPPNGPDANASRVLGPGEVQLTYGSCPAKTPCGGDPIGVWTYSEGGCIAELTSELCRDLRVIDSFIKAKGTVTIGPTSFKREIVALTQAKVELPKACAQGLSCSFVGTGLKLPPPNGAGFDVADCVDGPTPETCICDVERRVTETTDSDYTISESTIRTGTGETYDYCVEGSKMTYRDKFQGFVDGNIVMTKN
jgi:hypothetical protein